MGTSLDDPRFNLIRHLEKSMEDADADIFDDETTVPRRKKKRRSSGRRVSFADHHNTIHIFARDDDYASPGDGKSRVLASERNPAGSPRRSPRIMAKKRRSLDGYAEFQPSVSVAQDEVYDQQFHDPDGEFMGGEIDHEPGPVDTRHIMQGNGELLLCDEDITLDSSTFTNLFGILKEETPLSQVQPSLDGSMSIATVAPFPRRTLPQEPQELEDISSDMSLTIQCFRRRTALAKARLEFSEERQQSVIREPLKQLNGPQSPDERIQRGIIAQKLFCPQSSPLGVKCTGSEHAAAVSSMEFVNNQKKCRKPDASILDFIISRHEVASELTPASFNGTGAIDKEDVAPDSDNGAEDIELETRINPVFLQNVTCNSLDNEQHASKMTKDIMEKAIKKTRSMHSVITTVNIEAKVDKATHATDVASLSDFADRRSESRHNTCSKVNAYLCQSNEDNDMALEKGVYTNNLSVAYVLEMKDKETGQTQTMDVPRLADLLDRETDITHVQFQMCPPDGDASQCSEDEDMALEQTVYTSRDAGIFDRKHKETSQTNTRHMSMLMEPVDREPEVAQLQFQSHPASGNSNEEDMELEMTCTSKYLLDASVLGTRHRETSVMQTPHVPTLAGLLDKKPEIAQVHHRLWPNTDTSQCNDDMAQEQNLHKNNSLNACVLDFNDNETCRTQTMHVPTLASLLDREAEITQCPGNTETPQCCEEDIALEKTVNNSNLDSSPVSLEGKKTSRTQALHGEKLADMLDREAIAAQHPASGKSNEEDMELEMTCTSKYLLDASVLGTRHRETSVMQTPPHVPTLAGLLDKKPEIAQVHHRLWPNTDTSQCNDDMAQEQNLHQNNSLNACVLDFNNKETCRTQTMHVPTLASLLDREAEITQCPGNTETPQCCEEDMALEKTVDNSNLDSSLVSLEGEKTSRTQTLHGKKLADMLDREAIAAQANADLSQFHEDNMALERVVYTNNLSCTYVSEIKDKEKGQTQTMDETDLLDRKTEISHVQFQMCPPDGNASQCIEEEDMALEQTVYTSTDAGKHKETSQTKIMHMRMLSKRMDREPEVAQLQFQLCPTNGDSDEEDMELETTHTRKFSIDGYVLGTRQRETSPMQTPHLPTLAGPLNKKTEIAQVHHQLRPNTDTSQCNKDMAVEQILQTNNSLDACVFDFKDKETSKTQTILVPTLASLLDREAEITQVFELCPGTSKCCEEDMELEKTVGISNLDCSPLSHEDNKTSRTQALHGEMLADMLDRKAVAAQCPASHAKKKKALEQTVDMSFLLDKEQDVQASISTKYANEDASQCKKEACVLDFKDKETRQTQAMHVPTLASLLDRDAEITHVKFELRRDSTEKSECSEEDMELEQTVDISSFSDSSLLGIEKRTSGARTLHVEVLADMLDREAECPANEDTSQEVMSSEQTVDMNNLLVEEQNAQASMLDKVPEGESEGEEDMMLERTEDIRSLTAGNFKYLENDHDAEEDMIFEETPYASSLEGDFNCLVEESIQEANICQKQSGGDTTTTLIPTLMGLLEREDECTSFTRITMDAGYVEAQPSATPMYRLCSGIESTSKYRDMPKTADSEGLDQVKCEGTHTFKAKGISSTLVSHEHIGPQLAVTKDSGTRPAATCLNGLLDSKGPSILSCSRESEQQNEATVGRREGMHVFQSPTTIYRQRMVTEPYNGTSMKVPESTQQIEDKQAVSTLLKKCMELRQLSEKKKLDTPMQNVKNKQQVQDNHASLEQLLKLVDVKDITEKANVDKNNLSTESCIIQSTYESLNYVHLTAPLISIMLDRKKQLEAAVSNLRLSLTQKTSRLSLQNSAVSLSVEQVRGKKLLELQELINDKTGQLRLGQKDLLTWKLGVETEKLRMLQKNKSILLKEMEAMHGNVRQVHKQVHHDHYKLREDNRHINELHEKEKALRQSLLILKQKLGSMERRLREIKSDSWKMPHHSNPSVGCIMRKHRLLHYLQGWNIKDIVKQQNGHLIEIDYGGVVKQCLILQGNGSAVHVWSKLSPCLQSIEVAFPHLNASLPFQVILPRTDKCRIGHAKELPAALQQTNNVISSLLQLLDDVRKCRVGFRWLTAVGFSRSSENNICLAFAFATASRKLEITFGLDCLSSGLYPADILPSTVSLSTRSRKDPVTEHTIHEAMDNVPHGFCRFQRLCRSISRVLES